jgi:hypothetical protein
MIYRKLDANGDYTFGKQAGNFYVNTPAAVVQAILTRLKLIQGEWFLDTTEGVDYNDEIIGMGRIATYDAAIQDVILNTQGVNTIDAYASGINTTTRAVAVSCTVDTIYGQVVLTGTYAYQSTGNRLDIDFVLDSSILG